VTGGPTILVADDESDIVRLARRRLLRAGYTIVTAADGAEALSQVERCLPHLALLDVMMPKLTGIEVAQRLRATAGEHLPIILMSAGLPHELLLPRDADAFINKPFEPEQPQAGVDAVLADHRHLERLHRSPR
jgi:CheY-like chemotaxis protein